MPLLVVERGNDKGLTVQVEAEKSYIVGRENPQAAVKLQDPLLSRTHFEIRARNGAFLIRDMKSRNGTLLNDEPLDPEKESALRIGDKIQAGETIFSFLSDEKEEAPGGLIGKVIGGYRLIERVGRGGMGTVYKAEQISLNRQVALKVLSSKLMSDPTFVERFVQEARSAGGLNHPNIVSVFDVGSDRGIHYFSMEFMEHGSVGDILAKDGPVPWERGLEMMTDAARGLIFAEKRGIVHRDIKPDNLMLTSEGTVKIGDLGLAKKAEDVTGEGGGQIFGTPHFIAPEQAQGKPVDHRADIYALGATFYRVLSGKTPFSGDNVKEILVKQVREEPPPLKKLAPSLPDEMVAVVGKMMRKNPDDRYRSAQGLFEDLERIRIRYHLEAHGQARGTKVIAAVLGIGVIALGGVAWHFATKPKEVEYRDNPNQPDRPIQTDQPDNPPPPDPAKLAEQEFLRVRTEDLELGMTLKGGPRETWRDHEKRWLGVADKYARIGEKYAGTPKGTEAADRAKQIRGDIEAAKKSHADRVQAASTALAELLAAVDALAAQGKWYAALERICLDGSRLLATERDYLPDDAERTIAKRIDDLLAEAGKTGEALAGTAEAAAPEFPGTETWPALRALRAFRAACAPPAENPAPFPADLVKHRDAMAAVAGKARKAAIAAKSTALEAAREALDADRAAYFRTYLEIRRFAPPTEPGTEPGEAVDTGPFFSYRWDEALTRWESLLGTLRTPLYRDRVAGKVAQYRRCRRLFETLGAKVRSNEIREPKFPDSVKRGTNILLDGTRRNEATAEGVHVLRLPSRQKDFVPFREFTPAELYELFLNRGEEIPLSGEDHLDLAVFLAEAGVGEHAWMELTAASQATPAPKMEAGLKEWIESESILYGSIQAIAKERAAYAKARGDGERLADIERRRRKVEQMIDELETSERYYTTDLSILNRSLAGPDGPVPDRLFPDGVTTQLVQSLGVPGEPADPVDAQEPGGEPENGKAGAPEDAETAAGATGGEAAGSPPAPAGGDPATGGGEQGDGEKTEKPK